MSALDELMKYRKLHSVIGGVIPHHHFEENEMESEKRKSMEASLKQMRESLARAEELHKILEGARREDELHQEIDLEMSRNFDPMSLTVQQRFIREYNEAFDIAHKLVHSRESDRNAVTAIPDMFSHGLTSVADIIEMKMKRIQGDLVTENLEDALRELPDVINYAAFMIAMIHMGYKTR